MRLRGHHLICLNFFKGEGYNKEFVENIERILKEKEIKVVSGADDVCSKCPYLRDGVCNYKENAEEEIRELDELACKLLEIPPDSITSWDEIRIKLPNIMKDWKEFACKNCDWIKVCEKNGEWLRY